MGGGAAPLEELSADEAGVDVELVPRDGALFGKVEVEVVAVDSIEEGAGGGWRWWCGCDFSGRRV